MTTFPWTPGLPQARCRTCPPSKAYPNGVLVVAMTLVDGRCAQCRQRPDKEPRIYPETLFELAGDGPGF